MNKIDKLSSLLLDLLDSPKSFENICNILDVKGDMGGMQGFIYNILTELEFKRLINYNIDSTKYVLTTEK